jgi:cbb3-type cytochrome oxidase maturation protein
MDQATIGLTVVTGVVGLVFLGFLIWGIKSGQFHNVEEAKYQVFGKQKHAESDEGESEVKETKEGR